MKMHVYIRRAVLFPRVYIAHNYVCGKNE